MGQNKGNLYTLIAGLLCIFKLILQTFGIDIITNEQIDDIANGVAAIVAIVTVYLHNPIGKTNGKRSMFG